MRAYIGYFLKGAAMGAANVIPGVSGGTIAFITGIYEKLIHSLKSFDLTALQLLLKFRFRELAEHTNLKFLIALGAGITASIISLAKLLEFLFCNYPVLTNAFFFGLIVASVYLVGKEIKQWSATVIVSLIIGTLLAAGIVFLNPANANDNMFYLLICGMVAISSMILPGLSGSYVLLIMGNYLLVISAINNFFGMDMNSLKILIPFAVGCVIGLLLFARILYFIFDRYKDATIGLLTGFVFGSLAVIWPWKEANYLMNDNGQYIDKKGTVITDACHEGIVLSYTRYLPDTNSELILAFVLILAGIAVVVGIERMGAAKPEN